MADRLKPLPGCLVGSWRGLPMHIPDVSTPAGRRIVSIELPGTDITLHEDLGLATGQIRVTALLAGDDYIEQARAMQAACETPGPGTLVHPWLGEMLVVLKDAADISFRSTELRTVQVRLTFERWSDGAGLAVGLSTLAAIADAADVLGAIAGDLAGLAADAIGDLAGLAVDLVDGIVGDVAASIVGSELATILSASTWEIAAAAIGDGASLASWIADTVATIADAGVPPASPAIGVGPLGRSAEAALDPWSTVSALIGIATSSAASAVDADPGADLARISLACSALAAVADPLAAVAWESRQQAQAARAAISSAVAKVSSALTTVAGSATSAIRRDAWRALADFRRTVHQDLDDRIGRLPSIMLVSPPTRASAWVVAHHLFGDDPSAVRSGFEDIVTRNRLAHPSIVDVDPIEVLPR